MSDAIKHECGIALLLLKRPLEYYQQRYGSWTWGLEKMYLLMEKQHNRGQDGAGLATVKFDLPPGLRYMDRARSNSSSPIKDVFAEVYAPLRNLSAKQLADLDWVRTHVPFAGELFLGHLRYGTYGDGTIDYVHPQVRENNWRSRTLAVAGNFNLTNTPELFERLIELGQHPKDLSDTVTVLEKLGHFLDEANQRLFRKYKDEGYNNREISRLIAEHIDLGALLTEATKDFDGGYTMAGLLGHGDAFVCRDPWGIRPAFYLDTEEYAVVASERPVIQTVMNVEAEAVHEIDPGCALLLKRSGAVEHRSVRPAQRRASCSFERIYFSRGTDKDIYQERLRLGELLAPQILSIVGDDLDHTVFSFIPNTAETAFYGMVRGLEEHMTQDKVARLLAQQPLTPDAVREVMQHRLRVEKIAVKDIKLRTFITQDRDRQDLVQHVYDVTYGTLERGRDTLVVIDDSIVRGTTLRESILRILDRLGPRKIVVVSSSPLIRYPDCYGIDMARMEDLIAFRTAVDLLAQRGQRDLLQSVYHDCISENRKPVHEVRNCVCDVYAPFTDEELIEHMARLLRHPDMRAEVQLVFQTVENLHAACPHDHGDWYFTGNYPTPGGNRVANHAFINYIEGRRDRAY